jgi:hypothetical protein
MIVTAEEVEVGSPQRTWRGGAASTDKVTFRAGSVSDGIRPSRNHQATENVSVANASGSDSLTLSPCQCLPLCVSYSSTPITSI